MKIILSVNCLSKGGAERVASLWANGFAKFHHDVYVALFDNQRPISYSISLNVKINYIVPTRSNKIARYISRLLILMLFWQFKSHMGGGQNWRYSG